MKICQYLSLTSLLWIIMTYSLGAQPILTRIDSVNKCPDSLLVPVYVENFMGVASLSLKINYDTNILVYTGYQNQNPLLGGTFLMNGFNNQVIMSWFSLTPANIGNGTLVELKFFYTGNADMALSWDDMTLGNCVYTDLDGTDLPAVFEDGYIHGLMHVPTLVLPPDYTVGVGTDPILNWTGSGCAPLYWVEIATDSLFTNIIQSHPSVFGNSLNVQGLNLETTYFWRVKAFNALHMTNWSSTNRFKTQDLGIGMSGNDPRPGIKIVPNPAREQTVISVPDQVTADFVISMFNSRGELVWHYKAEDLSENLINFTLKTDHFPAGLYYVMLETKVKDRFYRQSRKLVITSQD